jgi:lysozyme
MDARVVDLSHHNDVISFQNVASAGIWGVIHKASQGTEYGDFRYATRRPGAIAAGLLWGAYHFGTSDPVNEQVDCFLSHAMPDTNTLLVLDYEDLRPSMSIQQAVLFLRLLEQKMGRKGALYSGNRVKETIGQLNAADRQYLCSHRLWLCQYGPRAVLPPGWNSWWLWQFTGDGVGPLPHNIPGIAGTGIDINTFNGTRLNLATSWP